VGAIKTLFDFALNTACRLAVEKVLQLRASSEPFKFNARSVELAVRSVFVDVINIDGSRDYIMKFLVQQPDYCDL